MIKFKQSVASVVACVLAQVVLAEEAAIQTPAPVIHLQENLDEADGLGWCIDTVGRGYAEHLHAHSCKPRGGDVQFSHEAVSGTIRSVAFPDKCVVALPEDARTVFGLADCDAEDAAQRFAYDSDTLAFHDAGDPTRCIAVGKDSRSAGPFMSRDLVWADCGSSDPRLRSWIIRD